MLLNLYRYSRPANRRPAGGSRFLVIKMDLYQRPSAMDQVGDRGTQGLTQSWGIAFPFFPRQFSIPRVRFPSFDVGIG